MTRTLQDQLKPFYRPPVKKTVSKQAQIDAIRSITAKGIIDYRFSFGKYSGELLEHVYAKDKDYLRWLYDQTWIDAYLKRGLKELNL